VTAASNKIDVAQWFPPETALPPVEPTEEVT
jgi:hypothetical protein